MTEESKPANRPAKQVQVMGAPPPVSVPHDNESGSEDEHEHEHELEEDDGVVDDGLDELMAEFPDDETEVDLTHLRIFSTKPLNLPRFAATLERLSLRQNNIRTIHESDFGQLTKLKDLDLYDNAIEHIGGLDHNTNLEVLDLSFNNIRHVSRVSHLGKCHTLYLVQNKIRTVRPDDLKGPIAESLRSLELGGNRLRSMENLGHLAHLQELWVGKNKIASLNYIDSLSNLRVLSIQSNRLTDLSGLQNLTNLQELYVSHNGITSLAGLENNTKLNTLDITSNRVESLECIAHLTEINQFWASDNQIKDINHLDSYLGPKLMPKLETVYLEGNPAQHAEGANYRRKVILALPQISQLDATLVRT